MADAFVLRMDLWRARTEVTMTAPGAPAGRRLRQLRDATPTTAAATDPSRDLNAHNGVAPTHCDQRLYRIDNGTPVPQWTPTPTG